MSQARGHSAGIVAGTPDDSELRQALEPALLEAGLETPGEIRRRRSEYRTSFPLEELELTLADGATLRLVFKRLDWQALTDEGRLAKPRFLHDPMREPAVYGSVLAFAPPGPPRCYGSAIDPARERHWLFIEWVDGRELFQVGDLGPWEAAARWLAAMHQRLAGELDRHRESGCLLEHDRGHYRRWAERARRFAQAPGQAGSRAASVDRLVARYGPAIEELAAMPKTVIHGEFYASNVLVAGDGAGHRVAPVDWELAAAAPGLVDLAALVSGGWSDEDRAAIVSAYRFAIGPDGFSTRQLDLARLSLAVQWLGWTEPSWEPPPGQRHDWLGEALALAERLEL
jgi:aminoglycoside phosphotransferase (APT) family kinase protein